VKVGTPQKVGQAMADPPEMRTGVIIIVDKQSWFNTLR
jgi:hypothetical protein